MSYKEFPKKYTNKLPDDWADSINAMETEEIKKRILECENNIFEIEADLETNEFIVKAKEELKSLKEPFSEGKARENAKMKFCLFTLVERGVEFAVGN